MRKFVFGVALFLGLFFLKSVSADAALAATISGILDNRQGSIPVTVSLYVTNESGGSAGSFSQTVAQGTSSTFFQTITSGDFPSVTWFTSCNSGATTTSGSAGAYTFTPQDVHCTTPNSTVSLTSTSCAGTTGNVGWKVNLYPAPNNTPNIANFKIFKAVAPASADTDTSPITVPLGTSPYSQNLTGLSTGAYNVKVVAYANSPDGGSSVSATGQFTCNTTVVTVPTNLVSTVTCSGSNVRVDFTWAAAAGTTIVGYYVETSTAITDPGPGGSWNGPGVTPSPPTNTYAKIESGLSGATTYWWHVKATPQTGSPLYSSSLQFTTNPLSSCYQAANARETKTCYGGNTGDINFIWDTATPTFAITSQYIQFSTDPNFVASSDWSVTVDAASYTFYSFNTYFLPATRYWRIKTQMGGQWYYSNARLFWAPTQCNTGVSMTAAGVSYCAGDTPSFRFQLLPSGQQPLAYYVGTGPNGLNVTFVAAFDSYSLDLDNGPSGHYWLRHWNFAAAYYDLGNLAPASCSAAVNTPAAPTSLGYPALNTTCDVNKKPHVGFTFKDNSTNENEFWLEVSSQPFTGPSTTNPDNVWAKKVITRTDGTTTGDTITFDWYDATTTNTAGRMDSGNANPQAPPGSELVPLDYVSYYWRVRAYNSGSAISSAIMYPNGSALSTSVPTGLSFMITPPCQLRHDLKTEIVSGSWRNSSGVQTQSFVASENVSVDVLVTNVVGANVTTSPAFTPLYFYYKGGASMPDCTVGTSGGTAPPDGAIPAVPQLYTINALAPGDTQTITVLFNVGSSVSAFTAYAYAAPTCTFTDLGTDPSWGNNKSNGFSYTVGVNGFFETFRGDVGSGGKISVGVNSSAFATPIYQSEYAIGAVDINNTNSNVQSKNNLELDGYSKNLVPSGGVYKYFADRFLAKAKANDPLGQTCTLTHGATYNLGNKFYYCAGTANIDALSLVSGNPVFFIDGDLNINNNAGWNTPSNVNSVVFIVKGNINVATSVQIIRAVLIAGGSFTDGTNGGEILAGAGASGKLLIWGALYVDGQLNLVRHWGNTDVGLNATTPSLQVAGYLANIPLLNSILSTSPVGWQEVAP